MRERGKESKPKDNPCGNRKLTSRESKRVDQGIPCIKMHQEDNKQSNPTITNTI